MERRTLMELLQTLSKKPEQSIEMLVDNVKQHFKDADVNEIKKILK